METAIYIRVSTDKQVEKGYSIPDQDFKLKALCVAQNLGEYKVYLDDGYTGKDMNRPALKELLCDIKEQKIKNIVIYKLDRLSRSLRDTLELIEDILIPTGVRLISLTENLDTSTPVGRLIISILSAFAQLERETIKERMQIGMVGRAKTGKWKGGGKIPFGYDYDKDKGILIPNSDAIKVSQLYDLYLQGHGFSTIAKLLGLPNGTCARQILERKASHGIVHYKGKDYKGQHEPIIDEKTYEHAMTMRKQRSWRVVDSNYLLVGLLVCGKCGAKMSHVKQHKCVKIVCYSQRGPVHLIKDPNCDNLRHRMIDIEKAVLDKLFNATHNFDSNLTSTYNNILQLLHNQHEEIKRRLTRLYNLYSASQDDLLLETINDNKKKLAELQVQIDAEINRNEVSSQITATQQKAEIIKEAWNNWDIAQKRNALRSYISKIIITDGAIDIYWRLKTGTIKTAANITI